MLEEKDRLDIVLVKKHYFPTRQKAKYEIEQGNVYVNGKKITKTSKIINYQDNIEIKGQTLKYVSRGGLKLEKAISLFGISLKDKICADIGASTGGFTDCMLQNSAQKVYAIDVGHSQLAEELLNNEKVVNLEGTNIKELDTNSIEKLDFISSDVSFISEIHVLPKIYELLKIKGKAVVLIKPQFEAGSQHLNKNGVVKNIKIHQKVIQNIVMFANKLGFRIIDVTYSPIKGPAGNIEYLLYVEKNENNLLDLYKMKNNALEITTEAFKELK